MFASAGVFGRSNFMFPSMMTLTVKSVVSVSSPFATCHCTGATSSLSTLATGLCACSAWCVATVSGYVFSLKTSRLGGAGAAG